MFEGNNSNTAATPFLDNPFQYPASVSNQLQLCGNPPVEFHPDSVNFLGNNRCSPFLQPNKREDIPGQPQQLIQLNNESLNNETDNRKASIFSQNPIFTGLRLSCDDDEPNSSLTSASGGLRAASSAFSYINNDIERELDQLKELDHFIQTQEENMVKGLGDIRQRHTVSFLSALEKSVMRKLREKDIELETVNRKNKELVERVKNATSEAQNWHYMAKYNESVFNVLKTNLEQAMQSCNRDKEGFGESNADDAASCINPNNYLGSESPDKSMICRCCKWNKVSMLLMPCRHLCVCKECESFVKVCPACQMMKTASIDVYLS